MNIFSVLCISIILVTFFQCRKSETLSSDSNEPSEVTSSDSRPLAKTPPTTEKPPPPKPEVIPPSPTLQKELRSVVNRWNELPLSSRAKT